MLEEGKRQEAGAEDQGTQDAGGQEQEGGKVEFSEEQQAALDRIIAERLTRARGQWEKELEREKAKAAEAAKKAEAEAETKRLAEQQEFQKLAEKRAEQVSALEGQVSELSAAQERLGAYQEAVEGLLKARIEALGEGAKTAVEGLPGDVDALARLQWLTANEGLFAKESTKGAGLGTPPGRGQKQASRQVDERRPYRAPRL